jgi:hypothetical protein
VAGYRSHGCFGVRIGGTGLRFKISWDGLARLRPSKEKHRDQDVEIQSAGAVCKHGAYYGTDQRLQSRGTGQAERSCAHNDPWQGHPRTSEGHAEACPCPRWRRGKTQVSSIRRGRAWLTAISKNLATSQARDHAAFPEGSAAWLVIRDIPATSMHPQVHGLG